MSDTFDARAPMVERLEKWVHQNVVRHVHTPGWLDLRPVAEAMYDAELRFPNSLAAQPPGAGERGQALVDWAYGRISRGKLAEVLGVNIADAMALGEPPHLPPVIDLTKVVVEHLKNVKRAQEAARLLALLDGIHEGQVYVPLHRGQLRLCKVSELRALLAVPEPSAPAPCPETRTDVPHSIGHVGYEPPAPCCPSCQVVREAAERFAYVNNTDMERAARSRMLEALAQPCAGRAGAPRKEES